MSRRIRLKRKFPLADPFHNNFLVSLLIVRLLKNGKKMLAQKIVNETLNIIENRTKEIPILILEKAIKNCSPKIEVKTKRIGGSSFQIPTEVTTFRGVILSLNWLVKSAKKRSGNTMAIKLANEILDVSNGIGASLRKKEEIHRMAEANKVFSHFYKKKI